MSNYKLSGVDVEAGYKAVSLIRKHVEKTRISGVLGELGGFGGLFMPDFAGMKQPVLVSGTDGVGTKLMLAFISNKHDTVGIDCVAMCVNDVICQGATPLFFLDYLALGKNVPEKVCEIVKGVSEGCLQAGCALIGGETAEMPGFYSEDEYDMAGFAVGMVDKDKIIDGSKLKDGDVLIGLKSSGVHSNGFSLIRRIFNINSSSGERLSTYVSRLGKSLRDELLTPTAIYVRPVLELMRRMDINAISHITGGGFVENVPRMLKEGLTAVIDTSTYVRPPIFDMIREAGQVKEEEMYKTFNMGIGMILAIPSDKREEAMDVLEQMDASACVLGNITTGSQQLIIK